MALPFAFLPLWGALGVGVAAVSVPIIIHLLSRRRFRIVTWAAMRFLLLAQKQTTRRLRLEQLILLLVRIGIVACLVLAMAAVTGGAEAIWQLLAPGAAGFGGGRSGRTHMILVLDGSLSMGAAEPGGKACFEKARDIAAKLIGDMQSGDGVSILLMKESPVWVVGEASQDPRKLLKELNGIRHPHGNSSVAATLNALAGKLREGNDRFDSREIYFLTDLQQTTWIPDVPADARQNDKEGGQAKVLQEIQKRARTVFVDVGRDNVSNAAVTMLALNDTLVTTNANVSFLAQVKNFGPQNKEKLNIKLLVGRWPAGAKDPEMRLAKTEQRELRAGEEQAVIFTHKFTAAGTYVVQVAIDEDDLRLDDTRSVILTVKDTVPVLLVNGKPSLDRFERATEYLAIALNPFAKSVHLSPFRPKVVTMAQFSDANQTNLPDYDCVFLCDVGQLTAAEVRRLEANVRRGAGLVIAAGDNMAKHIESYNRLLYKSDQGLLPARLLGLQPAPQDHYFTLNSPDNYKLPPLRAFVDDADQIALKTVRFQQYLRSEVATDATVRKVLTFKPELVAGTKIKSEALPIDEAAVIEWNPPLPIDEKAKPKTAKEKAAAAVRGIARYRGKVLLLTSTVNMDWNTWPGSPSFLAMMNELTRYAVAGRLREQSVLVGGALEEFFPSTGELEGTLIVPGEDAPQKIKTQPHDDLSIFRWLDTDHSGVYRLTIGQDPQEYLFAVNVPTTVPDRKSSESDLTRTDKGKLKAAYPGWDLQVVKDLGDVQHGGTTAVDPETDQPARPKPLGPWIAFGLLLVMILLLFIEAGLACAFGHYSASAAALGQAASKLRWLPGALGGTLSVVGIVAMLLIAAAFVEYAFSGDFLGFLPDRLRASIEANLDVPPPSAGESTKWTLKTGGIYRDYGSASAFITTMFPVFAIGALGLAVVVLLLTSLFEARSGVNVFLLVGLAVLGFVNLAVASLWLLPQWEIHFERQSWPDVVLLIDDSLSMGGVDPYRDEKAREPVTRLAERYKKFVEEKHPKHIDALKSQLEALKTAVANANKVVADDEEVIRLERRIATLQAQLARVGSASWKPTRLELAQAILLSSNPDWLTQLSKKNRLKIHIFHLDPEGRALKLTDASGAASDIVEPRDLDRAQKAVATLEPYGTDSRLGTAVRQVIDYYRGAQLSGIIMFTDGVTTIDESLAPASEYAAQKGVPLFFVGIGEDQEAREIELRDLQVEDPVFVNDRLLFEARLTGTGYKDLTIPVVLKVKEGDKEKELDKQNVKLDSSGGAVKVRLKHQPDKAGEFRYIVEAQVPKVILDELPPGSGKRRLERDIFVQENKLIRVLYIEGSARYEYRYIKNLLEREAPDKKNNKTIEIKVLLVDSDEEYYKEDPTALQVFPQTKEDLFKYDVIILGDADPRSVKLGEPRLRDLADFVKERGGGFLAIAGTQYMPHAYRDTPVAGILPIEIGRAPNEPDERTDGYRLDLTPAGRLHPIFRFIPDETENLAIWQQLAPVYWWQEGYRPKPLAEVLAVHPRVKGEGKAGKGQDDRHPLVIQQFMGAGRSMFFGFDESWRWRFREDELRFNQFWIQTVRYLARSKLVRTELRLDRQSEYKVGEPIKITVRFPDSSALQGGKPDPRPGPETKVIVTVELRAKGPGGKDEPPEIQTLQLAKVEGSWATYEGILTKTREGDYTFYLSNPDVSKQQPNGKKPSATAKVVRPPGEDKLRFNAREMIQAAAASRTKEELTALVAAGRKDPGYYTVATADQVLEDLSLETVAATGQLVPYSPRDPWPIWNLFVFSFLPVMMLLTGVWLLRKSVNLL
jgi:hypothetical protein